MHQDGPHPGPVLRSFRGPFCTLCTCTKAQPGSYIVVAEACYALGNCGLGSSTLTI